MSRDPLIIDQYPAQVHASCVAPTSSTT